MADLTPHPHLFELGKRLYAQGKLPEDPADADAAANAIADQPDQPDETLIRGFVGAQIERGLKTWRLVYLDFALYTWLLVPESEITAFERVADPTAPTGTRDMLWIDRGAQVLCGSGFGPNERRFLVGEYTLAADLTQPETSGLTCTAACHPTHQVTTFAPRCYRTRG